METPFTEGSKMKMEARFPGKCRKCGKSFPAGTEIDWQKGKGATCLSCVAPGPTAKAVPSTKEPLLAAGPPQPAGRNRRPGFCERCGADLAVGAGQLVFCPEDSGCQKHHDSSGYHLYCVRASTCTKNREAALAERKERVEKVAAAQKISKDEERSVLAERDKLIAGLANTECYVREHVVEGGKVCGYRTNSVSWTLMQATVNGQAGYVLHSNAYDDYRSTLYAPREALIPGWETWAASGGITPETARKWLEKYKGCSGSEAYEFIAGKAE